jgi:hypothetical protein
MALLLASVQHRAEPQVPASAPRLPHNDRVRIAEALQLTHQLGDRIWPGLKDTPMPILLVGDSAEFLVRQGRPGGDFRPSGDSLAGFPIWSRPRRLSPTMLATFPIEGSPTIVIGSAERTGKTSTEWVLTLLHEHFHQWQYSRPDYYSGVARLDLSQGDSTGMWMLSYPFPYDSARVAQAVRRWAGGLLHALERSPANAEAMTEVIKARDGLRVLVSPADYRYLEFELWQEGVARYIEYRAAQTAAQQETPSAEFRTLKDYRSYRATAAQARTDLLRELKRMDTRRDRRVIVYPLGAAIALLLDETRPEWKQAYVSAPFALAGLLPEGETSR